MRVLGIEGTAWAASAALYDSGSEEFVLESDAYVPDDGGIDPRESADHMADALPRVIATVLEAARDRAATDESGSDEVDSDATSSDGTTNGGTSSDATSSSGTSSTGTSSDRPSRDGAPIDAVAFSQGPGLGPCLRIAGTAARALAHRLDVPLVGVNHMVAHLEIGRHRSGFDAPVCLNASGANAHLLGFHDGRYRVLGETMDTGVGNALDKVARHADLSHPGGPKLEAAARDGELLELPYVVKGMDFSFAGIVTAAQDALDDGAALEDVAYSVQETVFAMLTEVAERALSLTGRDELVLGGGVGQNERLREMLATMCEARGAAFYAPEPRFLRDNAAMIARLGAEQLAAGDTVAIEDSAVRPDYRPDEVDVTWRAGESVAIAPPAERERRGAEAVVEVGADRVTKRRVPKAYRHAELDRRLRRQRTRQEARLTSRARRAGVPAPVVLDVDLETATLELTAVGDRDLQAAPTAPRLRRLGEHLATLHDADVVHGDPTTRNVRVDLPGEDGDRQRGSDDRPESDQADSDHPDTDQQDAGRTDVSQPDADQTDADRVSLIDFGLGYDSGHVEDHAMDLHVLEQSLVGCTDDPAELIEGLEAGYAESGDAAVLDRLREIERRGRYQ